MQLTVGWGVVVVVGSWGRGMTVGAICLHVV